TTADGSARRNRIRGSNEGISAVIDVEHRPLRTLEQDALPSATRGLETVPHAVDERRDARPDLFECGEKRSALHLCRTVPAQHRVVVVQKLVDLLSKGIGIREIADADRATRDLVLICDPDASPGGAD